MVSLRWSDLLLVVGIVLLFVFTPSVLAGGLGDATDVEGADFHLAAPREGEVLVYALLVQIDDRMVFEDRRAMTVVFGSIGPVVDGHGAEREAMDMTVTFSRRIPTYGGPELAPDLDLRRLVGGEGAHLVAEIDAATGLSVLDRTIRSHDDIVSHVVAYPEDRPWRDSGTPFDADFRIGQPVEYRKEAISHQVGEFTGSFLEAVFDIPYERPMPLDRVAMRGDAMVFGRAISDLSVTYGWHLTLDAVAQTNGPLFGLQFEPDTWMIDAQEKQGWWSPDVPLFVQNQAEATMRRGETTHQVRMTLDLVGREVDDEARALPLEEGARPHMTPPAPIAWEEVLEDGLTFEDPRFPYTDALRAVERRANPLRETALSMFDETRVVAVQFAYEGMVDMPLDVEETLDLPLPVPQPLRAEPLGAPQGENLTWWIIEGPTVWPKGNHLEGRYYATAVSRIVDADGQVHQEDVYDQKEARVGNLVVGELAFGYGGERPAIRSVAPLDLLDTRGRSVAATQGHDLQPDLWGIGEGTAFDLATADHWPWYLAESVYWTQQREVDAEGHPDVKEVRLDGTSGRALSFGETGATTSAPPLKATSAHSVQTTVGQVELIPVTATTVAGASAGILFLLAGLFARFGALLKQGLVLGLLVPLYAKITKDQVLDNTRRERILETLRVEPGLSASEIKRRLRYGWGTTVHHLDTLGRNGLVQNVREGHRLRWFVADVADVGRERTNALLANPRLQAFVAAVAAAPGADLGAVAAQIGLGRSITSTYGRRLEQAGLVRKEKAGRTVRFYLRV